MSSNTITIVGNLTGEPELRFTNAQKPFVNFTIASTERIYDKQSGQYRDGEPLFMSATVWGDMAENIVATLNKGSRVIASGKLKQRKYETKTGEQRTATDLEVDAIGPDLRYATATVQRISKRADGSVNWSAVPTGFTEAPDTPAWNDETPF